MQQRDRVGDRIMKKQIILSHIILSQFFLLSLRCLLL
jgi:hypothetical protein